MIKNNKYGHYRNIRLLISMVHLDTLIRTITQYRRIYMITSFCNSMCNFSFRGRATKRELMYFLCFWTLISFISLTLISTVAVSVLGLHFDVTKGLMIPHHNLNLIGMFTFISLCLMISVFIIFSIWALISLSLLSIRRLHDMNYSGVCYWVWISALISFFISETSVLTIFLGYFLVFGVIILIFSNSFPTTNKYGKVDIEEIVFMTNKQNG